MNKTRYKILITGATGSLGKALISKLLNNDKYQVDRLVIYSRDELKQWEIRQAYPSHLFPQLRLFLGDIRDYRRLRTALENVDTVIHAAALKQVPAAEYNPIEFVKTNVLGSENLIQACLETNVQRVIALSTDKAAAPINLYGATKLCSDKLFIAANNIKGARNIRFSVVRYGNVMGSRGSVIPFFIEQSSTGILPITDIQMTRFNITLEEGADLVLWAAKNAAGGEIFVPKIPSYRISDLAEAIGPNCKKQIIGIRPGEKLHEELITKSDSCNTIDFGKYYAILSNSSIYKASNKELSNFTNVDKNFSYSSENNPHFLTIEELRSYIKSNVDQNFIPI